MPTPFTIYNCGTGYNRSANDIVARLNRETASAHIIHDGPGSGGFVPGGGHNPGGKTTLGGWSACMRKSTRSWTIFWQESRRASGTLSSPSGGL